MKVLMHLCCAPCSIYPVELLRRRGYEVTGFFFNPNIHGIDEYNKRKDTLKEYASWINLEVIYKDGYLESEWLKFPSDFARCNYCYEIRLEETFKYAKDNGFDSVTTSLLVSPYQNHDLIIEICENLSKKYQVEFYYEDYRSGYRYATEIARTIGIYRQKYCGCILSRAEREKELNLKGKSLND